MTTPAAKLEWAHEWIKTQKVSWVGGEWVAHIQGSQFTSINPATTQPLSTLCLGTSEIVDQAVRESKSALQSSEWARMSTKARAAVLQKMGRIIREHHVELATLETLDNGKLFREAFEDDIPEAADVFDYYAGWINKIYGETCPVGPDYLNYTLNEPVGVCGLIVPWNFPFLLACWKLAPCLAMGNTAIIKPSPYTSLSLVYFMELLDREKVLPLGVVNLVLGGAEVGDLLTKHAGIDKISFTGSTNVGKRIVQNSGESNLKQVSLELGGKSPNIIFEDIADVDAVLQRSFQAMFSHKGEKCSEPTRFLIHRKHYDSMIEVLSQKANEVICGDPFDSKSGQGAQCNEEHFNKILRYIEIGKKEGAKLVAGGTRDSIGSNANGYFVRPTIFADVESQMKISQDEIFGPVLVISRFDTDEEAIRLANDSIYGLAAGLWTQDISRAHRVASKLQAGMVFINRYGCYDFASPFGGYKQSGWGKEMAIYSLKSYTKTKSVWVKL
jgi:aldehyde dehydrogenase (NAD+)